MIKSESATINFVGVFLFLKASAARFPTATELTKDRFDLQYSMDRKDKVFQPIELVRDGEVGIGRHRI